MKSFHKRAATLRLLLNLLSNVFVLSGNGVDLYICFARASNSIWEGGRGLGASSALPGAYSTIVSLALTQTNRAGKLSSETITQHTHTHTLTKRSTFWLSSSPRCEAVEMGGGKYRRSFYFRYDAFPKNPSIRCDRVRGTRICFLVTARVCVCVCVCAIGARLA